MQRSSDFSNYFIYPLNYAGSMKAGAFPFSVLKMEGRLTIPFFQRGYIWIEDNWQDLLEDMESANKKHFWGSLIFKHEKETTGEPKKIIIIDGQQRLTTMSIMLKALYDTFSPGIKTSTKSVVEDLLLYRVSSTSPKFQVRIQHSRIDRKSYKKVITSGLGETELTDAEIKDNNPIMNCYRWYTEKLSSKTESAREFIFNTLTNIDNKMLVIIDLDEDDNEQTIFDTINTAGVRLTSTDIIKNKLFQKVVELFDEDQAIEYYKNTWENCFLKDEEANAYWLGESSEGRMTRTNSDILLHSVAVIQGFYNPVDDKLGDLPTRYKEKIDGYDSSTKDKLIEFIKEIKAFATIYRMDVPVFDKDFLLTYTRQEERLFHILHELNISTFHPYILYILKKYPAGSAERAKGLYDLEKFVMRNMMAKNQTRSYINYCKEFIDDPSEIMRKYAKITDAEVAAGLRDIRTNGTASLILFWIELKRLEDPHDVKELHYHYSLEHIMPQKWEPHWTDLPTTHTDGTPLSVDEIAEAKAERYKRVYWLGNMTLLRTRLNSSLRNHTYERKMNGEGKKKGIKDYASLTITRADLVEPFQTLGQTKWNESKIEGRTRKLEEEIKALW